MYSDLFAFTMPRELTDMGKFDTSYEHQPTVRCAIYTYLSLRRLGLEKSYMFCC